MKSTAALVVAVIALVLSFTGAGEAARKAVEARLKPGQVVRLDKRAKVPAAAIPRLPASALPKRVRDSARLAGKPASAYRAKCPDDTAELGTWCLMTGVVDIDRADIGRNDYAFAERTCASLGGYVPSAGQLIAAADVVKLSSTIDDAPLTASIDMDPTNGLKDQREMSSTLVTVTSGSSASGSLGVTQGSKGDQRQGEPDPIPVPSDPMPSTLQYVTVFDNANKGGFAGSKPVSQPERFRCAFNKTAGSAGVELARVRRTR